MPTLEASEEEVPTPKITFNVKAKTTTQGLSQAIEDAQLVSDHVRIEAEPEKLTLSASGDLMGATIILQKGNDALLDLEVKENAKATFSLSYLSEIIKAASATSDIATLEFSSRHAYQNRLPTNKRGKTNLLLGTKNRNRVRNSNCKWISALSSEDFAKYPFLKQASKQIEELQFTIETLPSQKNLFLIVPKIA